MLNFISLELISIIQLVYRPIGLVVECSPMARETGVQSQVVSYQRLKKWYLISPCLTLSIIRYVSREKWSNPGKGVPPPRLHLGVVAIERELWGSPRLLSPTFLFNWFTFELIFWNLSGVGDGLSANWRFGGW